MLHKPSDLDGFFVTTQITWCIWLRAGASGGLNEHGNEP